jgi:hypothetical protein
MALIKKQYKRQRKSRKQQKRLKKRKQQKRKTKKRGKYVRKGGSAAAADEAGREYINILENMLSKGFDQIINNEKSIEIFNMIYNGLSGAENVFIVTGEHTLKSTDQNMVHGTTYLILYESFKRKKEQLYESFKPKKEQLYESFMKTKYIGKFTPESGDRGVFNGMEYTPNTYNGNDMVKICQSPALKIDAEFITDNNLTCFTF